MVTIVNKTGGIMHDTRLVYGNRQVTSVGDLSNQGSRRVVISPNLESALKLLYRDGNGRNLVHKIDVYLESSSIGSITIIAAADGSVKETHHFVVD